MASPASRAQELEAGGQMLAMLPVSSESCVFFLLVYRLFLLFSWLVGCCCQVLLIFLRLSLRLL